MSPACMCPTRPHALLGLVLYYNHDHRPVDLFFCCSAVNLHPGSFECSWMPLCCTFTAVVISAATIGNVAGIAGLEISPSPRFPRARPHQVRESFRTPPFFTLWIVVTAELVVACWKAGQRLLLALKYLTLNVGRSRTCRPREPTRTLPLRARDDTGWF